MADPAAAGGASYTNTSFDTVKTHISTTKNELDKFKNMEKMSETDMIEYNMAASKYSTMVSLASGLIKNLSDTEKQVANKM